LAVRQKPETSSIANFLDEIANELDLTIDPDAGSPEEQALRQVPRLMQSQPMQNLLGQLERGELDPQQMLGELFKAIPPSAAKELKSLTSRMGQMMADEGGDRAGRNG